MLRNLRRIMNAKRKDATRIYAACDWPKGGRFKVKDDPDEHKPCWLITPGGESHPFCAHGINGVDQNRARFIADACNAVLDAMEETK